MFADKSDVDFSERMLASVRFGEFFEVCTDLRELSFLVWRAMDTSDRLELRFSRFQLVQQLLALITIMDG